MKLFEIRLVVTFFIIRVYKLKEFFSIFFIKKLFDLLII